MSGLGKLERKINPLSKYDPLSASRLTGQWKKPPAPVDNKSAAMRSVIPPPTSTSTEVVDSQRKARMGAALRMGFGRSRRAGETSSGTAYQNNAGGARTLGGV